MTKKKWISRECRFPEDVYEILKDIKKRTRKPISRHIRAAVSEYIKHYRI